MHEAGIGRVLVASLHQGIADILPTRLGFYENWLNAEGLRDGTIGLAPLYAVLSFLRQEGDSYALITTRAGRVRRRVDRAIHARVAADPCQPCAPMGLPEAGPASCPPAGPAVLRGQPGAVDLPPRDGHDQRPCVYFLLQCGSQSGTLSAASMRPPSSRCWLSSTSPRTPGWSSAAVWEPRPASCRST